MCTPSTDASALADCVTFQTLKPQASPHPLRDEITAYVNPAYLSSAFESERGESYSKYVLRLRIRYMQNTIRRMTEQPCELPDDSTEERAAALIHVLQEIGALELLEE